VLGLEKKDFMPISVHVFDKHFALIKDSFCRADFEEEICVKNDLVYGKLLEMHEIEHICFN
jgi:hypothetical protein